MKKGVYLILLLGILVVLLFAAGSYFLSEKQTITGKVISGASSLRVSHYSFEGNANDLSENSNNGIISGADCNAQGKFGKGCRFDGVDDYIKAGPIAVNTAAGKYNTVNFWMFWEGNNDQSIFSFKMGSSSYGTYMFYAKARRCMGFSNDNVNVYGFDPSSIKNKWVFVSLVFYNGIFFNKNKVYINGVRQDLSLCSGTVSSKTAYSNTEIYLGQKAGGGKFFGGIIDDLSVYSREISLADMQGIYSGNCDINISTINGYVTKSGNHNNLISNLVPQESYLCYDNEVYACNLEEASFATSVLDKKEVGGWQCNLQGERWVSITPRIYRAASNCYYGSNCGPFDITSNVNGNFSYELWWSYYLKNGSIVDYCANILGNEGKCSVNISNQGNRKVLVSNLNTPVYNSIYQTIQDNRGVVVENITLKVAVHKDDYRSEWSAAEKINVVYNCTNECNVAGEGICNSTFLSYRKVCGNYDSDICLEWSEFTLCSGGEVCAPTTGKCGIGEITDTCSGDGGVCSSLQINNAFALSQLNCPEIGYGCYKCNQSRGYEWSAGLIKCLRTNCAKNCGTSKGECQQNAVGNATLNSSLECCDDGSCYICNQGRHFYNASCVDNNCSGLKPSSVGENGTLLGNSTFSNGPILSWSYTAAANLMACQWRCDEGYYKKINLTFDGCVFGVGPCQSDVGCKNASESILNVRNVSGSCSEGYKCYTCDETYSWNGSGCISACPNGCTYNQDCFVVGYRMMNGSQRLFCSSGKTWQIQNSEDSQCIRGYECETNYCRGGNCTSLISELRKTRTVMERLTCWIRKLFDSSAACS